MSCTQDLEQEILLSWQVTADLKLLANEIDEDDIQNKILGIMHVYDMRFRALWSTYEKAVEENYA